MATLIDATGAAAGAKPAGEPPVTPAQQALVYLQQLRPSTWAYNVPFGAHVTGELDPRDLRRAFAELLDRHASLRTAFVPQRDGIRARRLDGVPDFACVDARGLDARELEACVRAEARRPFDLKRGPMARLRLYQRGERASVLLFTTHHVAIDLASVELVIDELLRRAQGLEPRAVAESDFPDFAAWQNAFLAGPQCEPHWAYWQARLAGAPVRLDLPGSRRRPPTGEGASWPLRLDARLSARLEGLARELGTSLFRVLLAAYAALLQRLTGEDDLVLGSPFGGRSQERFADVVGYCVNLLPLRLEVSRQLAFVDLVGQVAEAVRAARAYQDLPFPLMVQRFRLRAEGGRAPLVQTTFALHITKRLPGLAAFYLPGNTRGEVRVGALRLTPAGLTHQEGQFDLALEMVPQGDELWGALKYDVGVIEAPFARRLAERFAALLEVLVERPEAPLRTIELPAGRA